MLFKNLRREYFLERASRYEEAGVTNDISADDFEFFLLGGERTNRI